MLTYLRIPGAFDIGTSWTRTCRRRWAAGSGQEALDDTATAWEQVTERSAGTSQIKDYQAAIGYKGSGSRPGRTGSRLRARAGPAAGR